MNNDLPLVLSYIYIHITQTPDILTFSSPRREIVNRLFLPPFCKIESTILTKNLRIERKPHPDHLSKQRIKKKKRKSNISFLLPHYRNNLRPPIGSGLQAAVPVSTDPIPRLDGYSDGIMDIQTEGRGRRGEKRRQKTMATDARLDARQEIKKTNSGGRAKETTTTTTTMRKFRATWLVATRGGGRGDRKPGSKG